VVKFAFKIKDGKGRPTASKVCDPVPIQVKIKIEGTRKVHAFTNRST